ncbi:MAG TPA: sigma-70 family RNA polymerase sigma factor [Thiobacillus sp.]
MTTNLAETLAPAEMTIAIESLCDADMLKLRKIAERYAFGRPFSFDELLQEAFIRVIDGARNCPRDVTLVKFLANVMRSITSSWVKASRTEPVHLAVESNEDPDLDPMLNSADTARTPAEMVLDLQEALKTANDVIALFDDDQQAQLVLEGHMDELTAEEIRELLGIDKTAYATIKKRIRRRIDQHYPDGRKS